MFRRHNGVLAGIMVLILLVSTLVSTALTILTRAGEYERGELDRLGYGDLTVWVNGEDAAERLSFQMQLLDQVKGVSAQRIIMSNYELDGKVSDSEGEAVVYEPGMILYRFYNERLDGYVRAPENVEKGMVYLPASLQANTGDTFVLRVARNGVTRALKVAGFYEDPFTGSSLIGMKSVLISQEDYDEIRTQIEENGSDALARTGAMLHIRKSSDAVSDADFLALLNKNTSLAAYLQDSHSRSTIYGFMLLLDRIFSGIFLAFAVILLLVSVFVIRHSMQTILREDRKNFAILITQGVPVQTLRQLEMILFAIPTASGTAAGLLLTLPATSLVSRLTVTSGGILIPSAIPWLICGTLVLLMLLVGLLFIRVGTKPIAVISPVKLLRGEESSSCGDAERKKEKAGHAVIRGKLNGRHLLVSCSLRQLSVGKRHYAGVMIIAVLLTFFASFVVRLDAWLGPEGEGLMEAFNPADHDLGVQTFGQIDQGEIEDLIQTEAGITARYAMAMPTLSLNGVDYTANVITDPSLFHIIRGEAPMEEDEVVITQFLADDFSIQIGDTVRVAARGNGRDFRVSGIYQCANDTGANFGMGSDAYFTIAKNDPSIWCVHYFLQDKDRKDAVYQLLQDRYGDRIHVHEDTWPGLESILAAMKVLIGVMYVVVAVFILVAVVLAGKRIKDVERHDLSVMHRIGFSLAELRVSYMIRFGISGLAGGIVGVFAAAILTDPAMNLVIRLAGISGFSSHPGIAVLGPLAYVVALYLLFSWASSGDIFKRAET